MIALDPASSEFSEKQADGSYMYELKWSTGEKLTADQMVDFWADWCERYPHHLYRRRYERRRLGRMEETDR